MRTGQNLKQLNHKYKSSCWYIIVSLLLIISIVPLIVSLKVANIDNDYIRYFSIARGIADFFTFYKAVWLTVFTILAVIFFLYAVFTGKLSIRKNIYCIPIGLYALLAILSTKFSEEVDISLLGYPGRYEGMIVLLCYMAVLFVSMNVIRNENQIKALLTGLILSATIIAAIGILQYFGFDILRTSFIKGIINNTPYNADFPLGPGEVYSTLAHYNYVGSYMAMLFPFSLVLFLCAKKTPAKIATGLFSLLMLSSWISNRSRAGVIGGVFALLIITVFYRKTVIMKWKYIVGGLVLFLLMFTALDKVSSGKLMMRADSLKSDITNILSGQKEIVGLKGVRIDKGNISILSSGEELNIESDNGILFFKDDKGNNIEHDRTGNQIEFKDQRYKDFNIVLPEVNNFKVFDVEVNDPEFTEALKLSFVLTNEGFKYKNFRDKAVDLEPVEKWGFQNTEGIGSDRGYIWSRSIPLLRNAILTGYGADTFPLYFPQHDYIGKLANYGTPSMFVDKPHNLYLNVAISTGVISLISLLAIFILYFVSSFSIYYKSDLKDLYSCTGFAIFAGFNGYLISGLFNDSVVMVAPVFWVLLGMGISINHIVKSNRSSKITMSK